MPIFKLICTLKGIDFKYKVEANSLLEAKIKVREHIKNKVEITEVTPTDPMVDNLKNIFGF